jgi:antitoxin (DNA-binding transcriptional repressor) of toxin-antitoxin stability system
MHTISIRQLHEKTGEYVRKVAEVGEIRVTDHGRTVAKLVLEEEPAGVPYFARRRLLPRFKAVMHELKGGTDSTILIAEDREGRA